MTSDGNCSQRGAGAISAGAAFLSVALCLVAAPAVAQGAYTTLQVSACTTIADDEGFGSFVVRCEGFDGVDVFVSVGDLRTDVDYGSHSKSFETFGVFNSIGDTVEWVADDSGLMAAILRFHLADPETGEDAEEALVVSRIGQGDVLGCVVGVVSAREDQHNGIARGMAALAPLFDCTTDITAIVGPDDSLARSFQSANT